MQSSSMATGTAAFTFGKSRRNAAARIYGVDPRDGSRGHGLAGSKDFGASSVKRASIFS